MIANNQKICALEKQMVQPFAFAVHIFQEGLLSKQLLLLSIVCICMYVFVCAFQAVPASYA